MSSIDKLRNEQLGNQIYKTNIYDDLSLILRTQNHAIYYELFKEEDQL